jgi:hypothetical protein
MTPSRDLVRARATAVETVRHTHQRVPGFLVRAGNAHPGDKHWTKLLGAVTRPGSVPRRSRTSKPAPKAVRAPALPCGHRSPPLRKFSAPRLDYRQPRTLMAHSDERLQLAEIGSYDPYTEWEATVPQIFLRSDRSTAPSHRQRLHGSLLFRLASAHVELRVPRFPLTPRQAELVEAAMNAVTAISGAGEATMPAIAEALARLDSGDAAWLTSVGEERAIRSASSKSGAVAEAEGALADLARAGLTMQVLFMEEPVISGDEASVQMIAELTLARS